MLKPIIKTLKKMNQLTIRQEEIDSEFNQLFDNTKRELLDAKNSMKNAKNSLYEMKKYLKNIEKTEKNKMKLNYLNQLFNEMETALYGASNRIDKFF